MAVSQRRVGVTTDGIRFSRLRCPDGEERYLLREGDIPGLKLDGPTSHRLLGEAGLVPVEQNGELPFLARYPAIRETLTEGGEHTRFYTAGSGQLYLPEFQGLDDDTGRLKEGRRHPEITVRNFDGPHPLLLIIGSDEESDWAGYRFVRAADVEPSAGANIVYGKKINGTYAMGEFWRQQGWVNADGTLSRARWADSGTRVAAIRFLVENVLDKDPREVTNEDFRSNGLWGLLTHFYNSSNYAAVSAAFPELNIRGWEMICTPRGIYPSPENRVAAVRELVKASGKGDPRDLARSDFESHGLRGLLHGHYNGSTYAAVVEAFPEQMIKEWEMAMTPMRFYESPENRVAAVRWLAEKLGKDPREITQKDFKSNRLLGLLDWHYNGSPYEALLEAGLVTKEDEYFMRNRGPVMKLRRS
ncbi:MAG: hypothetical protein KGH72_00100 [Candidatus Micrarchaeota archaeon]|nr:hypothetical protein [Candidatus Micrarchaeota archaeon]